MGRHTCWTHRTSRFFPDLLLRFWCWASITLKPCASVPKKCPRSPAHAGTRLERPRLFRAPSPEPRAPSSALIRISLDGTIPSFRGLSGQQVLDFMHTPFSGDVVKNAGAIG